LFVTTRDIKISVVNQVVENGKNLGLGNVDFVGPSEIIDILEARPEILEEIFPTGQDVIPYIKNQINLEPNRQSLSGQKVKKELAEFSNLIIQLKFQLRGIRIAAGVIAILLLARLICELLSIR